MLSPQRQVKLCYSLLFYRFLTFLISRYVIVIMSEDRICKDWMYNGICSISKVLNLIQMFLRLGHFFSVGFDSIMLSLFFTFIPISTQFVCFR